MENISATPRQLWALYCITKKDYRNENLTKDEAAKLIKELGDPNYKKALKKKTLSKELLEYLKSNIDDLYKAVQGEISYKSIVEDDIHVPEKDRKQYAFIGCGCGITYLKYRKSKKAEELAETARKYRNNEIYDMIMDKLPKDVYKYLESIGCPFGAIWAQSQQLQLAYYRLVKKFAETKGIKFEIVSHLD